MSDFNPFGVGSKQGRSSNGRARCACCMVRFEYEVISLRQRTPVYCPACIDHHPVEDEPESRELQRFRDHWPRMHQRLVRAEELLAEAYRERDEKRQAIASALWSRSEARSLLNAVLDEHVEDDKGGCSCGAGKFPCVTVEAYEKARKELGV